MAADASPCRLCGKIVAETIEHDLSLPSGSVIAAAKRASVISLDPDLRLVRRTDGGIHVTSLPKESFMRRLLVPHMSGSARLAVIIWLITGIAVGAILLLATLRPAAAMPTNPLDIIAPAGDPVGLLVALASITGAAIIGCVGALMLIGAGGHPRRKRA